MDQVSDSELQLQREITEFLNMPACSCWSDFSHNFYGLGNFIWNIFWIIALVPKTLLVGTLSILFITVYAASQ